MRIDRKGYYRQRHRVQIGPRINASGRIQNGKEAVDLLTEKDFSMALEKANQINQYNGKPGKISIRP